MPTAQQTYPAPFDAVAARYDEIFTSSRIGQAQRASVWSDLATTFDPGDHVLEIGCGTGVDACFLAQRGVRVTACDSSSRMVDLATRRIRENGLQKLVQPRLLRAEDINTLPSDELFDGAFSDFGALNCVEDLRRLACGLADLLKPGATALLCWMGPYCAWEVIWYLSHGDMNKAFRRWKRNGVTVRIADGTSFPVRYSSVKSLARAFAPEFRLKSVKGIGITVPPSYLEPLAHRHARLLRACEGADRWLGRCPAIRSLGDHVMVRLQRETRISAAIE